MRLVYFDLFGVLSSLFCHRTMTSVRKRGKVVEGDQDEGANVKERTDDEKKVFPGDLNLWRHLIPEAVLGTYIFHNIDLCIS